MELFPRGESPSRSTATSLESPFYASDLIIVINIPPMFLRYSICSTLDPHTPRASFFASSFQFLLHSQKAFEQRCALCIRLLHSIFLAGPFRIITLTNPPTDFANIIASPSSTPFNWQSKPTYCRTPLISDLRKNIHHPRKWVALMPLAMDDRGGKYQVTALKLGVVITLH